MQGHHHSSLNLGGGGGHHHQAGNTSLLHHAGPHNQQYTGSNSFISPIRNGLSSAVSMGAAVPPHHLNSQAPSASNLIMYRHPQLVSHHQHRDMSSSPYQMAKKKEVICTLLTVYFRKSLSTRD